MNKGLSAAKVTKNILPAAGKVMDLILSDNMEKELLGRQR